MVSRGRKRTHSLTVKRRAWSFLCCGLVFAHCAVYCEMLGDTSCISYPAKFEGKQSDDDDDDDENDTTLVKLAFVLIRTHAPVSHAFITRRA